MCGKTRNLELHHVYNAALRKTSEKHGFTVWLCHDCHNEPPTGVHYNRANREWLQRACQFEFEKTHTRSEFMEL
jgi:hypothetical protein